MFGYTFTSVPLLRSGLALGAVIPLALAADTISIAIKELVDNRWLISRGKGHAVVHSHVLAH